MTPFSPLILYAWQGEAKNSSEARALSATFSCAPSVVESSLFSVIARVALLRLRQIRSRFYGCFWCSGSRGNRRRHNSRLLGLPRTGSAASPVALSASPQPPECKVFPRSPRDCTSKLPSPSLNRLLEASATWRTPRQFLRLLFANHSNGCRGAQRHFNWGRRRSTSVSKIEISRYRTG